MAAAQITLIKEFLYRGLPEEFSNSYHLDSFPDNRGNWVDLVEALAVLELEVMHSGVTYKRALVYEDSDHPAIWTIVFADEGGEPVGNLGGIGAEQAAGDQAAVVSWRTGLVGSSGKPIWLRKYFHGVWTKPPTDMDFISDDQNAALVTFGEALRTTEITAAHYFADKNGRRPDGPERVDEFITTRTLKRRGKRPH